MVLYKLEDFDTNYQDAFDGNDIKDYEVYSDSDNEKVGTVKNILVDESGHFRYLIVDTGFGFLASKSYYQSDGFGLTVAIAAFMLSVLPKNKLKLYPSSVTI
ncbi:MAG: hypothetical protein N4J56_004276 [Chroococcidiopsis sp. SAG 2025]|uniref:PRC-barrel domain-containing protein n=1 Tax=Chroococcidiopsis sp. SAG 2025 TaxID=171389 RepID=UPI002936F36A|nr:PRC-barrel domain-containing protein [Chroococcidiopsis sp. SAG 2025]MDV2994622.1 hypothetical protein [Chroococcidiopsis sp. SAG 2025]